MSFVVVHTAVAKKSDAVKLAGRIVKARLAACVQFHAIRSVYRWKGRTESASEYMLACKTRASLAGKLTRFIREHHGYELPEITVLPVRGGLAGYLDWIRAETADRGRPWSRG